MFTKCYSGVMQTNLEKMQDFFRRSTHVATADYYTFAAKNHLGGFESKSILNQLIADGFIAQTRSGFIAPGHIEGERGKALLDFVAALDPDVPKELAISTLRLYGFTDSEIGAAWETTERRGDWNGISDKPAHLPDRIPSIEDASFEACTIRPGTAELMEAMLRETAPPGREITSAQIFDRMQRKNKVSNVAIRGAIDDLIERGVLQPLPKKRFVTTALLALAAAEASHE